MSGLVCNGEIVQRFASDNNVHIQFRATVVDPQGLRPSYNKGEPRALPMLVYFGGFTDEDPIEQIAREMSECVEKFASVAEESFIFVQPLRPDKHWWVLEMTAERDGSDNGWADGAYSESMSTALAGLVGYLAGHDGVDRSRVALAGFSAGAYACTELLAQQLPKLCVVIVGGLHGHATPDPAVDKISAGRWREVEEKFVAYLAGDIV